MCVLLTDVDKSLGALFYGIANVVVVRETLAIKFLVNFKLYLTKIDIPNHHIAIYDDITSIEVVGTFHNTASSVVKFNVFSSLSSPGDQISQIWLKSSRRNLLSATF